jgi:hypothetical protein
MDGVASVLAEARTVGLEIRVNADRLVVRGPQRHEAIARRLLAQKPAVIALLTEENAEIAWRVAAMRPQVPLRGAIPLLMARLGIPALNHCISCGDPIPAQRRYRCAPCARATWAVLHDVREAVPS